MSWQWRDDRSRRNRNRGNPLGFLIVLFIIFMATGGFGIFGGALGIPSWMAFVIFFLILGALGRALNANNTNRTNDNSYRQQQPGRTISYGGSYSRRDDDSEREIRDFTERQSRLSGAVPPQKRRADSPRAIADQAVLRAGNQLDSWELSLQDIGVLGFRGSSDPDVIRSEPVPAATTHVRPFVVIDLPYRQGNGPIRFALYDETGAKRYDESNEYQLTYGRNFLAAPKWQSLDEERSGGRWTLRVSIGSKPLAVHEFMMRPATTEALVTREQLAEDGEIDPALIRRLTDQGEADTGMSLDELLTETDAATLSGVSNNLR